MEQPVKGRTRSASTADTADDSESCLSRTGSSNGPAGWAGESVSESSSFDAGKAERKLQCPWCIWARSPQGGTMMVRKFTTLEACQKLFSSPQGPSGLVPELLLSDESGVDVLVFKESVIPAEDACSGAGQWIAETSGMSPEVFRDMWLNLVVAVVLAVDMGGERMLGAVASCHCRSSKVTIWMSGCEANEVDASGRAFINLLRGFGFCDSMTFTPFAGGLSHVLELDSEAGSASASDFQGFASHGQPDLSVELDEKNEVACPAGSSILRVALPGFGDAKEYRVDVKNSFIDDILPLDEYERPARARPRAESV
eukprot:TRINITY_DN16022_c0_g1_i2.p1 TRINITY_DN16022_c0_g1~~TRINITY_DN16022_c0_g1_i2.p1  ORF type:complete len:313 (+),score=63.50 TRINITY_DN16022_c0_g1_i2:77-1015(+)